MRKATLARKLISHSAETAEGGGMNSFSLKESRPDHLQVAKQTQEHSSCSELGGIY